MSKSDTDIYMAAMDNAFKRFKEQLMAEVDLEEFDWARLLSLFLEDNSPLQDIFSVKALHLASLYEATQKAYQSAFEIEELGDDTN